MNKNLPATARLALELRHDDDGLFRWYEMRTDTAAEVCPAANTPDEAWENAAAVWRGTAWNLKRLSPTVAEIDGDFPPMPQPDPDVFETIIVVQVPHQRDVFAAAIESEKQLREMAELSVGDNYEWPGHYENPDNEDDPGDWIDETTVEDMKDAIAHDMHCAYFITEDDYKGGWHPTSHHRAIAVRNAVDHIAAELGWGE